MHDSSENSCGGLTLAGEIVFYFKLSVYDKFFHLVPTYTDINAVGCWMRQIMSYLETWDYFF